MNDQELLLDDTVDAPVISLRTFAGHNILHLNASKAEHLIRLATEQGLAEFYAKQTIDTTSGDTLTETVGNNRIQVVEDKHETITNSAEIHHQSATDVLLRGANNIELESGKNTEFEVGNDMRLDIREAMNIKVGGSSAAININSGSMVLDADGAINIQGDGGGDISIGQAGGGIKIDPAGNITLFGTNVNFAGAVSLSGKVNMDITSPPSVSLASGVGATAAMGISDLIGQKPMVIEESNNWVDLEYTVNGKPVADVNYTIYDTDGAIVKRGTLEGKSITRVPLPADVEHVTVIYDTNTNDVNSVTSLSRIEELPGNDEFTLTWNDENNTEKVYLGQLPQHDEDPQEEESARQITQDYWQQVQDNAVQEENFGKYLFGHIMGTLGAIGHSASDGVVSMVKDPGSAGTGAVKGIFNLPGDMADGAITISKFIADGWSMIADEVVSELGGPENFTAEFRETKAFTFGHLMEYDNQAEESAGVLSQILTPGAITRVVKILKGKKGIVNGVTRRKLPNNVTTEEASGAAKGKQAKLSKNANDSPVDVEMGEPVNAITGAVVDALTDFTFSARLPLAWERHYSSQSAEIGVLGYGWQTPADARLVFDNDGLVIFYHGNKTASVFPDLATLGVPQVDSIKRDYILSEDNTHYIVRSVDGISSFFPKDQNDSTVHISKVRDRHGNELSFLRDDQGLYGISDSAGLQIRVTSEKGLIRKMERLLADGSQQTLVEYAYHPRTEDLISVTDQSGHALRYKYDNHCLTKLTFKNGLSFHWTYDQTNAQGKAIRAWGDGNLYHYRFSYDEQARQTTIINSLGQQSIIDYNESYLPISVTDHNGHVSRYAYNGQGKTTLIEDELGRQTRYQYDAQGNLQQIERPDGKTVALEHDGQGNPVMMTDPAGNQWQQTFDPLGQLTARTSPSGATTGYAYNPQGDLTAITAANGSTTLLDYSRDGRLERLTYADGSSEHYDYDAAGRIVAAYDPLERVTRYLYDEASRLERVLKADGTSISCGYDAEGQLISYTDEKGQTTRLSYFGIGQLHKRINPDGSSLTYRYDTEENLIALVNEKGEEYLLERDHAGRVIKETDYFGQSRSYSYDPAGQLLESVDPLGKITRFVNDDLGRLTEKTTSDGATERFRYDVLGNLTGHSNAHSQVERRYDAESRLIEETVGGDSVRHEYDIMGQRICRQSSLGNTIRYSYDELGRNSAIVINGSELAISRNQLGLPVKEQFGAIERTFDYTGQNQLAEQLITLPGGHKIQRNYEYDELGNLTARKDSGKGNSYFSYDPMGRLSEAINPLKQVQKFLHDPAGNLLQKQQTHSDGSRTLNYGDSAYRYDAAGNLTARTNNGQTQHFSWDANNRLISATDYHGIETQMTYDAQGRRLSKQGLNGTTHFIWDGDQLLADNINGNQREFVYYPDSFEPLAIIDGNGSINLIHTDAVGLPHEVTNEDGNIVWSASYDALGNTTRIDSTNFDNPLRFQGQYYDEEIDLNYNRYRYFDSKTSSFISQDPLGLAAGSNTYAYAPNVWSWIDPLVLCKSLKGRTASVDEGKLDYLFGKAKGGKNAGHNLPRTNQNAAQMRRLGLSYTVEGRAMVRSHLDEVVQNDSNILKLFKNEYGSFEVRESLFSGPSGKFSKFESTWELMPDGSRRLTTVIPYGE